MEKKINSYNQSKNDIFSNKIRRKFKYRSKRSLAEEEEGEDQIKNNNKEKDDNKNKIKENNQKKELNSNKFDKENIEVNKDNKQIKEIIKNKYKKELIKSPKVTNNKIPEAVPKTEDFNKQGRKFRRYFYYRAKNKEAKENNDKKDNLNKEIEKNKIIK